MYEVKNGQLFYHGHLVDGVDLSSFRILSDQYFVDKNAVYRGQRDQRVRLLDLLHQKIKKYF